MKSDGYATLSKKYYTKMYNKVTIELNELISISFSPFDIKYRKPLEMFSRASRRVSFAYFPQGCTQGWGCP